MILVDPRIGSKHLGPLFTGLKVEWMEAPLEFADCMFDGNGPEHSIVEIGVEIKGGRGGSDFIQSMQSDRLVGHQVPGLAMYDRRYLIIEGLRVTKNGVIWTPPRRGRTGGALPSMAWRRPIFMSDVKRFVTGLEESGLRVRWTATPEETAHVIVKELYAFWQKDYDQHSSVPANVLYQPPMFSLTREDPVKARIRRVAVALKAGVGVGRSKAVAVQFESIYDMVTAEVDAWEGIEGVGKKTIGDVQEAIHATAESSTTTHVPGPNERPAHRTPPNRRVSAGLRPVARSARHSRNGQDDGVDASPRPQRRVSKDPAGRRMPARSQSPGHL